MKRSLLLTALFALLLIGQTTAQSTQRITLQEAINIALENNFQLKQAENNLELADYRIKSEYADFLPSISGSFRGSQNTGQQFVADRFSQGLDPFVSITSRSISGGIGADLSIFNGFENILSLRISESSQRSSEEQLKRAKENLIFNTATRYLQVLLNQQLLEIAQENLNSSQQQLNQIQAQVEVGSLPVVDLYDQESIVAQNELTVTERENTLQLSRLLLLRSMQLDPQGTYEFVIPSLNEGDASTAMAAQYNLSILIDEALNNRSDYKSEMERINTLKYQLQLSKNSLLPTVGLNADLSSRFSNQLKDRATGEDVPFSDQFFDQQVNRSIGFSINIPIFSNWNRMYNIQSARVDLKNAEFGLEDTRLQIIEEVTQAYTDYQNVVKSYQASEKSLIASEKAYETQQERYNVGASTLIELSQSQARYVEAQSNFTSAQYNLIFQKKLLDYYLGKLSGENVEF